MGLGGGVGVLLFNGERTAWFCRDSYERNGTNRNHIIVHQPKQVLVFMSFCLSVVPSQQRQKPVHQDVYDHMGSRLNWGRFLASLATLGAIL